MSPQGQQQVIFVLQMIIDKTKASSKNRDHKTAEKSKLQQAENQQYVVQ